MTYSKEFKQQAIKLSDEILLLEYNGKKILEYWLKRKATTNSEVDVSSLMKNPDDCKINDNCNYLI